MNKELPLKEVSSILPEILKIGDKRSFSEEK